MHRDLLDILVCPVSKTPLELVVEEESAEGEIVRGYLYSAAIDHRYAIEDGIPNLLPPTTPDAEDPS